MRRRDQQEIRGFCRLCYNWLRRGHTSNQYYWGCSNAFSRCNSWYQQLLHMLGLKDMGWINWFLLLKLNAWNACHYSIYRQLKLGSHYGFETAWSGRQRYSWLVIRQPVRRRIVHRNYGRYRRYAASSTKQVRIAGYSAHNSPTGTTLRTTLPILVL